VKHEGNVIEDLNYYDEDLEIYDDEEVLKSDM